MLGWIVGSSLRFRLLAIALGAAVLAAGANQARQMPVDALPEFAPPMIEVQTEALGLSAPEVEDLVTLNLEELLNGTPWLTDIHSTTVPGLSSILLTFEPGTDVLRARQLVQERLALSFAIPNVAKPPVIIQPLSTTNRVMMVGLSSKTVSPIEMGILARWNIRPRSWPCPASRTCRSGDSASASSRCRSMPTGCWPTTSAWTRSSRRRATPCGCRR